MATEGKKTTPSDFLKVRRRFSRDVFVNLSRFFTTTTTT